MACALAISHSLCSLDPPLVASVGVTTGRAFCGVLGPKTRKVRTVSRLQSCYSTALLLYSTLLYSTLLYSTLLYSTLLYSTLLYSTLLCSALLYSTLLYSTLTYSTLPYSTLTYSTLHRSTRCWGTA